MYSAPSVSFPVGRSHFGLALMLSIGGFGAVVTAVWGWQATELGWRQGLSLILLIVFGALAAGTWRATRSREISWDGEAWHDSLAPDAQGGSLAVALDLQSVLLVLFSVPGHRPHWLWLERRSDPPAWPALRRAVYSRARNDTQREPQRAGVPAP